MTFVEELSEFLICGSTMCTQRQQAATCSGRRQAAVHTQALLLTAMPSATERASLILKSMVV